MNIRCRHSSLLRSEESESYSPYSQFPKLILLIDHSANGNATMTAPSSWNDDTLAAIFQSKYPKTITTYYPYSLSSSSSRTGMPSWAGVVIGVLIAVLVIGILLASWFLRRRCRPHGGHEQGSDSSHGKHRKWMVWTKLPASDPSVSPSSQHVVERPTTTDLDGTTSATSAGLTPSPIAGRHESGGEPIHELERRSP
jgi:hypothetical protein